MDDIPRKQKIKFKPSTTKGADKGWIIKTIIITFVLSAVFTVLSQGIMDIVGIFVAVLVLFFIIFLGIAFDVVGMAVTTADETPFHSMAARRVKHADCAISLIKNKDKVSNFCNDVVGDICGIVSGSAAAAVVTYVITALPSVNSFFVSLLITALVASLTVGGKALGKNFAIKYSSAIVYFAAKVVSVLTFGKK